MYLSRNGNKCALIFKDGMLISKGFPNICEEYKVELFTIERRCPKMNDHNHEIGK